jgi:hypothetical protein
VKSEIIPADGCLKDANEGHTTQPAAGFPRARRAIFHSDQGKVKTMKQPMKQPVKREWASSNAAPPSLLLLAGDVKENSLFFVGGTALCIIAHQFPPLLHVFLLKIIHAPDELIFTLENREDISCYYKHILHISACHSIFNHQIFLTLFLYWQFWQITYLVILKMKLRWVFLRPLFNKKRLICAMILLIFFYLICNLFFIMNLLDELPSEMNLNFKELRKWRKKYKRNHIENNF